MPYPKKKRTDGFDSDEELYFSYYIKSLLEKEFITNAKYHPNQKQLSPPVSVDIEKHLSKKVQLVQRSLLMEHKYRPDWIITWADKAKGIFYWPKEETRPSYIKTFFISNRYELVDVSIVDIKGIFIGPHNNSAITFPINQKWLYDKYGIYVQKVIISNREGLFRDTFCPSEYIYTDTGKNRKIHYDIFSIGQFAEKQRLTKMTNENKLFTNHTA